MAIWQVAMHFVHKNDLCFNDPVLQETLSDFTQMFPEEKSWSETIRQYGNLDSTCMEISIDDYGYVDSVHARIDLRKVLPHQLELICDFAKRNGFLIEYRKYCEPSYAALIEILKSSPAHRFLKDPAEYLERAKKGELERQAL